jgi:hypothetical protein
LRPQRRYPRYRCNQRLCVRYRLDGRELIAYGRCTVVGKGGIGALLTADLPLGQVAHLEIALPSAPAPRALKAQVKNRSRSNYGFQFMEVDERAIAVLLPLFQSAALMIPAPETTVSPSVRPSA